MARDSEEAFIGAMFQNLGRLLTEFYFPEEAQRVRQLCGRTRRRRGAAAPSRQASLRVLGLSYEELGLGVARSWGLPDTLQRVHAHARGRPARHAGSSAAANACAGSAAPANDIADVHARRRPGQRAARMAGRGAALCARRSASSAQDDAARSRQRAREAARAGAGDGRCRSRPASPARRLLAPQPGAPASRRAGRACSCRPRCQRRHGGACRAPTSRAAAGCRAADMLAAGIQDITNTMVADNFRLNEVLRMILETMYRALGFRRVVFCLRDPKTDMLDRPLRPGRRRAERWRRVQGAAAAGAGPGRRTCSRPCA